MNNIEIRNIKDVDKQIAENQLKKKDLKILEYGNPYYDFTINLQNEGSLTLNLKNVSLEYLTSMNKDYILKMFCIFPWYNVGLYDKIFFDSNYFLVTVISKKKITLTALYDD